MYNFTGFSGATMTEPLKLFGKPVTRVENFCASGMDAFRNACFAVAAGVYDVVVACGVEKLSDQGASGIPIDPIHPVLGHASAPAMFALAASRAFHEWGWTKEDLANVAVKNPRTAQSPKRTSGGRSRWRMRQRADDLWPLGRFDCCAVSDGSAAVVITRPEIAKDTKHKDDYVVVKANALAIQSLHPMYKVSYNWLGFPATRDAARAAYAEAGVTDPLKEIDFAEVHDCFTSTELFNIGDLGFVADGKDAPAFVRDGHADVEGELPVNPSGGLKCFGHPIGATGCRMIYEVTKQLQGRADGMQVKDAKLGMAHNLGGPGSVCSVTILGRHD
jgi:acetyl-CoA C-acetyltransferase